MTSRAFLGLLLGLLFVGVHWLAVAPTGHAREWTDPEPRSDWRRIPRGPTRASEVDVTHRAPRRLGERAVLGGAGRETGCWIPLAVPT